MINFTAYKTLLTADGKTPLDVSFSVEKGSFLTIYGKSGVGKTTILRILAGLTETEKSRIDVNGEIWNDTEKNIFLPVQNRNVGFVFQDYALFPNLTVSENLEFALHKESEKTIINELLELMELTALQKSKPTILSGGQKQRVAIARAIVRKPKILLLDEPMSAIDQEMRSKLQDYLLKIHTHFQLTTILVSHHVPEIYKLSDRVLILDKGKITLSGTPEIVFPEYTIQNNKEIEGEIVYVKSENDNCSVGVKFRNTIFKLSITKNELGKYSVGQKLKMNITLKESEVRE